MADSLTTPWSPSQTLTPDSVGQNLLQISMQNALELVDQFAELQISLQRLGILVKPSWIGHTANVSTLQTHLESLRARARALRLDRTLGAKISDDGCVRLKKRCSSLQQKWTVKWTLCGETSQQWKRNTELAVRTSCVSPWWMAVALWSRSCNLASRVARPCASWRGVGLPLPNPMTCTAPTAAGLGGGGLGRCTRSLSQSRETPSGSRAGRRSAK